MHTKTIQQNVTEEIYIVLKSRHKSSITGNGENHLCIGKLWKKPSKWNTKSNSSTDKMDSHEPHDGCTDKDEPPSVTKVWPNKLPNKPCREKPPDQNDNQESYESRLSKPDNVVRNKTQM